MSQFRVAAVFSAALCGLVLLGCPANGPEGSDGGADDGGQTMTESDGGSTMTGSDAGFRCPNAAYLLCDDFEGGFDTQLWTADVQNGALKADTSKAARGTTSMHSTIKNGGGTAHLFALKTYSMANAHLWGRMFVYVPMSAQASLENHSDLVRATGTNSSGSAAIYSASIGAGVLNGIFFQASPQIDETSLLSHVDEPRTPVPLDRWFCLEWDFNHKDKQLRLFLDGALIPTSVMNGYEPGGTVELRVGANYEISEMWMDSVAVASDRVGCAR